jgi:glycine cleavage system H protein
VNSALADGATAVNTDPYGQGWLIKVRMSDPGEADRLMSAAEYRTTTTA